MKKFVCIILISLMCCSLTGCGQLLLGAMGINELTDTAKEFLNDAEKEAARQKGLNLMKSVTVNSRSGGTDAAMKAYFKAQQAVDNGTVTWYKPMTWSKGGRAAIANKARASFELAAAADPVYQDSLLHGNGDNTSFFDKLIAGGGKVYFIWIIFILALLLLFFFLFGRKKQRGKQTVVVQSAPAPAAQPVIQAAPQPVYNAQYQKTAISDESYRRMIEDNCKKAGLDSNQLLLECNGNLEQAFQQSNTAVAMKSN